MERDPLVSIIAPVYNVEQYLPKMIDSVLAQTFTDFELLLVDDGTPDNSGKICDEVAARDNRIRVIHKKNGGSASARNEGMKAAKGKYFFFVDSDDWIEEKMLETLVGTAEKYQCMLTVTGYCMEYYEDGKATAYDVSPEPAAYLDQEDFRRNAYRYFNQSFFAFPWNKLYLADHIRKNKITWPENFRQWNDLPFNVDYMMDISSAVFVPGSMYHYFRSRPGAEGAVVSESPVLYSIRREQFEYILKLYQYWGVNDTESMGEIHAYYVSRLLQCIQETAAQEGIPKKEKYRQIKEILSDGQTRKSLGMAKPKNFMMRTVVLPLRWGLVSPCYIEGKAIGFVKNKMANTFYHLRASVVNKGTVRKKMWGGVQLLTELRSASPVISFRLIDMSGAAAERMVA